MRFVAFGCSHTWGCGILPGDSWNTPPSTASWVEVLSKKFNIPVLNLSWPGGSNLLTLDTIRSHKWQEGDIAVIQWTYFERSTIFDDTNTKFKHISAFRIGFKNEEYVKDYYNLYSNYHTDYMNLLHIEHAYLYLAAHGIPKVARFGKTDDCSFPISGFYGPMLADFQKLTLEDVVHSIGRRLEGEHIGADGGHFSPLVHEVFAEEYVSEITNLL
jgi:hypothetical protein